MAETTMPGVAAGSVLVFIPTVGQFVVSDLLGGAKVDMLGNLLQRLFTRSNPPNWPRTCSRVSLGRSPPNVSIGVKVRLSSSC